MLWIKREREIARLRQELEDERATVVVVECAQKRQCAATIEELQAEVSRLLAEGGT